MLICMIVSWLREERLCVVGVFPRGWFVVVAFVLFEGFAFVLFEGCLVLLVGGVAFVWCCVQVHVCVYCLRVVPLHLR